MLSTLYVALFQTSNNVSNVSSHPSSSYEQRYCVNYLTVELCAKHIYERKYIYFETIHKTQHKLTREYNTVGKRVQSK